MLNHQEMTQGGTWANEAIVDLKHSFMHLQWRTSKVAQDLGRCPLCDRAVGLDNLVPHLVSAHGSDSLKNNIAMGPQSLEDDLVTKIRCVCGHQEEASNVGVWSALYYLLEHARINPEDHQAACLLGAMITINKE